MFGQNPVAKPELDQNGSTLTVVGGAPFFTIQGEGPFAGRPAVFLRLHGCPLRCYFCDTNFSSPDDPRLITEQIVHMMNNLWTLSPSMSAPRLAVITGGEPTRQNLSRLVKLLQYAGWRVQVETAGLFWQECLRDVDLVVSPKTPTIHEEVGKHALCFKYVLKDGQVAEDDGLPFTNTQVLGGKFVRLYRPVNPYNRMIYVSPMDEGNEVLNRANRKAVAESAMKFGYRAGLQLHKFMELE